MGAKVRKVHGTWAVVVHHERQRKMRAVGPATADKRRAEEIARKINASIEVGTFGFEAAAQRRLPCSREIDRWLVTYRPTIKPTTAKLFAGLANNHLKPFFEDRDLRELREPDFLDFVAAMQAKDLAPSTIHNALGLLRRVINVLIAEDKLAKNPLSNLGRIMRRVQNASAKETQLREAWTREEAGTLLQVACEHEPRFGPLLELLFATGMRRGEALGLKWADVDLQSRRITVRRSLTLQGLSTPKSGRSRRVALTEQLVDTLFDVLADRQRERIAYGWPETPEWVFCSQSGSAPDPSNTARVWTRVRRRAQKQGVRPLPMHSCRHSWATWALQAGKNIRWVADQLGHSDPSITLNHYAHAMPEDEADLSFAELGGARRRNTAKADEVAVNEARNYAESMARREGFEPPTLRFEAGYDVQEEQALTRSRTGMSGNTRE